MVTYKVTEPRFYNDRMYGPGTGRNFIKVDKPFPKDKNGNIPAGLVLVEQAVDKKAASQEVDRVKIKKVMMEMIKNEEGCTPEGVPTMAPLKSKTKLKFSQELRDELLMEIRNDEQNNIERDDVSFTNSPAGVQTL